LRSNSIAQKIFKKLLTEEELIKGCKKGVEKYQFELVNRYASKLLAISRRYAKSIAGADDILQETFIKVFKYIDRYDAEKGNLEGWLVRITINTALDQNKKYGTIYDHGDHLMLNGTHLTTPPKAITNLSVEELLALLDKLPIGYKTVFNLYVIEQYSHFEIAEMLNIKEATSRSQLNKARKMLQKMVVYQENYQYEQRAI
jgi:RNA polymerase sigma factor (sigma-70 family)